MALGTVKYGMPAPVAGTAATQPATASSAVTPPAPAGLLENPAVWAVGVAALMLGLIGASTSARVGPIRASISAGAA